MPHLETEVRQVRQRDGNRGTDEDDTWGSSDDPFGCCEKVRLRQLDLMRLRCGLNLEAGWCCVLDGTECDGRHGHGRLELRLLAAAAATCAD